MKNCEIIQKRYYDLQVDFSNNHCILKHLQEELRKLTSSDVTLKIVTSDPSNDKVRQIIHLENRIIVLESYKEYLARTLSKKDMKLEQLHEKFKSLNSFTGFLESST